MVPILRGDDADVLKQRRHGVGAERKKAEERAGRLMTRVWTASQRARPVVVRTPERGGARPGLCDIYFFVHCMMQSIIKLR